VKRRGLIDDPERIHHLKMGVVRRHKRFLVKKKKNTRGTREKYRTGETGRGLKKGAAHQDFGEPPGHENLSNGPSRTSTSV